MRALTLWQPWASAMALGLKRTETRPEWAMQLRAHVGADIAVHASAMSQWPGDPGKRAMAINRVLTKPMWDALTELGITYPVNWLATEAPLGAIVAVVRITEVLPIRDEDDDGGSEDPYVAADPDGNVRRWSSSRLGNLVGWTGNADGYTAALEAMWGDYTPGRVAVLTDSLRPLAEPVRCRGHQRLWTVPDDVAEAVASQLDGGGVVG